MYTQVSYIISKKETFRQKQCLLYKWVHQSQTRIKKIFSEFSPPTPATNFATFYQATWKGDYGRPWTMQLPTPDSFIPSTTCVHSHSTQSPLTKVKSCQATAQLKTLSCFSHSEDSRDLTLIYKADWWPGCYFVILWISLAYWNNAKTGRLWFSSTRCNSKFVKKAYYLSQKKPFGFVAW